LLTPRRLIAGNWKMHGLAASLGEARAIAAAVQGRPPLARVAICPPATLIHRMSAALAGTPVLLGGQDCRPEPSGAFTGSISAEMLADAGAQLVILGHSERRRDFGETDSLVAAKVSAAFRAGLEPIVCVGERADERRAGRALAVVLAQVRGSLPDEADGRDFAVAYEPVWAIGAGVTPTLPEIGEMHSAIREALAARFGEAGRRAPILYGGSVSPANAGEVLAGREVGGALVGGASLTARTFVPIIDALAVLRPSAS